MQEELEVSSGKNEDGVAVGAELDEVVGGEESVAEAEALSTGPADAGEESPPLEEALQQARLEAESYLDRVTRTQAEMDNLRKRTAREVENARKFALEPFARDLLSVADSMDLGLNAVADGGDLTALREGMELTRKQLYGVLERFNIEVLDAQGVKFNPEQHEAMTMVPNPEMEPNTVIEVIQKGYTLNGRLLRPARVVVSTQ